MGCVPNKKMKIYCDINKCLACRACEIACALEHSETKKIFTTINEESLPKKRLKAEKIGDKVIALSCQHCGEAPCVAACMSGALAKDKETGETMHNKNKCVGCWMCVMSCPFGVIIPDSKNHIAVKCDLCGGRDDFICVAACPTKALFAGTREEFEKKLKEKNKKKGKLK